jgi:hypothetical protein
MTGMDAAGVTIFPALGNFGGIDLLEHWGI